MKAKLICIPVLALALLAGCAASPQNFQADAVIPPPVKPPVELRRPVPTTGSLFVASRADYFTDLRAHQVGDLVIVQIVENNKAKYKNDTKAKKINNFKLGVPRFFGMEGGFRRDNSDKKTDPLVEASTTSDFDAKSELKKEDTVTASIACTVIEVLPNGLLVVRGSREVQVNGETEHIILQGLVRPSDITTDNTVKSTQVADAKIFFTGRGVLTDKQQPGWLARLLDTIWPF